MLTFQRRRGLPFFVLISLPATAMGFDDARHLLSRTSFGGTRAEIHALEALDYTAAVDRLLANPRREAMTHAPDWIGMGPAELGDAIEGWSGFDEYRSEMIARTELMDAYNSAAIGSYDELGVEYVEAIDGDDDEECRNRVANNPYTLDEAASEEDHPNGTLDWIPVL